MEITFKRNIMLVATLLGLASSRICVMAAGGRMGLKAGSSDPDGGCSFTPTDCR